MDEPTSRVWVKTSALDKALLGKSRRLSRRSIPFLPTDVDLEGLGGSFDQDDGDHRGVVNWGWARGTIIKSNAESTSSSIHIFIKDELSVHNGVNVQLPPDSFTTGDVVMGNINDGNYPDDLMTLTHLHEPAVLHSLRRRYAIDKIYTATGPILIAVNPFKDCDFLFSEVTLKRYRNRGERLSSQPAPGTSSKGEESNNAQLPPHIYGIADDSYRSMMGMLENPSTSKSCNQCILISGESGSGKTVSTRFVMQYLASLSRCHSSDGGAGKQRRYSSKGVPVDIELQILQSSPILESFGNARTIRNDNSSRFGKFTQIHFTGAGSLTGASTETYLLEKVRLVSQAAGERNYHIFYEILKGMDNAELEKHFLDGKTAKDFALTVGGGTYDRRDKVDDGEQFQELIDALDNINISQENQENILAVTCSLLHASNLSFKSLGDDESKIDEENPHLHPFSSLLGVADDSLNECMCSVPLQVGKETHIKHLSKETAEKAMEAFIKGVYWALFTLIVKMINDSISVQEQVPTKATIGVLDIFGFESFGTNSLEQLCINYCNEILQQQYNLVVFKREKEEYEREGIDASFISFSDNQGVLDLIDSGKPSIFNHLADQCKMPRATDNTFANSMYQSFTSNKFFEAKSHQVASLKFSVAHYAGLVEYDVEGFLDKNRDEFPKGATELLRSSSNEIVKELATIISPPDVGDLSKSLSQRKSSSISGKFRFQLREMRGKIDAMNPHFIRCLKPNDELVPEYFDPVMIVDQLRSAGVVEAIRISRIGYPQRFSLSSFLDRYWMLGNDESKAKSVTKEKVEVLVAVILSKMSSQVPGLPRSVDAEATADSIQVGKTTVFLRQNASEFVETLRHRLLNESTIKIQAVSRGYVAKKLYTKSLAAIVKIQCNIRRMIAMLKISLVRRHKSATIIQSAYRRMVCHNAFTLSQSIALWLQRVQRGRVGRSLHKSLVQERQVATEAAIVIQCASRCKRACAISEQLAQERQAATDAAIVIQCAVRYKRACAISEQYLHEATVLTEQEHIDEDAIKTKAENDMTDNATDQESMEKPKTARQEQETEEIMEESMARPEKEETQESTERKITGGGSNFETLSDRDLPMDIVLYPLLLFLGGCGMFTFSLTFLVVNHFFSSLYKMSVWSFHNRKELIELVKNTFTRMRMFRHKVWPCISFLWWLYMTLFTKNPSGRKLLSKRHKRAF